MQRTSQVEVHHHCQTWSHPNMLLTVLRQRATSRNESHGLDFCHATLWHSRPASPVYHTLLQLHRAGWEIEPGGI